MALLLREALGDSLRRTRVAQSRTLREVSNTARVSLGYLSEVERGRKEASSELLNAICDALAVPLADVMSDVSESLSESTLAARAADADAAVGVDAAAGVDAASPRIADDTRVVIPAPARALAAA
ncbi:transcriptional regulator [Rhodococcus sp. RS1C4]|uniref:helix-turn-helix domain-containing protein n=1 Tax=Nocardiaceae TaxID=85025 RepID=UPI0003778B0A|nr:MULTISPECIES: helix-turn-helix domain-containing protein [Rhodococcus]OZC44974.1 transcriptional regulator [Rhodococcus sp. RS1C4]OZC54094.1 transcriptional regulator [Rhodococcus sp. 06-621-2]OZC89492.1 transcriptional regulator [Rhodococcus sp. 06-418-1B]OZD05669.1 transcriptional regulator [Rhodococcus sp. 06-156-4C]OZD16784.1 transcriptional regulator [Rhodococcus sp. 06-156-4a]